MKHLQTRIAAFVKTPGLSLAKTRLAADVGRADADVFYQQSIACVEAWAHLLRQKDPEIGFHLAVAEKLGDAESYWPGRQIIAQGQGGLGDRLDCVYTALLAEASEVVLIGMDAPQLDMALWQAVRQAAAEGADFVVGPASDGGFYLLFGKRPIPKALWQAIPYSAEDTCSSLIERLQQYGKVKILQRLTDVDHAEDLPLLQQELAGLKAKTEPQIQLLSWLLGRGANC